MKTYFRRLLCWLGWHHFVWKHEEDVPIILDGPPPDHARCKYCGITYGNDNPSGLV